VPHESECRSTIIAIQGCVIRCSSSLVLSRCRRIAQLGDLEQLGLHNALDAELSDVRNSDRTFRKWNGMFRELHKGNGISEMVNRKWDCSFCGGGNWDEALGEPIRGTKEENLWSVIFRCSATLFHLLLPGLRRHVSYSGSDDAHKGPPAMVRRAGRMIAFDMRPV